MRPFCVHEFSDINLKCVKCGASKEYIVNTQHAEHETFEAVKKQIFETQRKAFLKLWHTYHAKFKIPYSHDDANDFFDKLTLIFKEG